MHKFSQPVRFAIFAALLIVGLALAFTGHAEGAVLLAATPVLTRDDLESLLSYIFSVADEAGSTKEEMREALEQIADLADPDSTVEQVGDEWQVTEDGGDSSDPEDDDEPEG
jgi:hypothetical protein